MSTLVIFDLEATCWDTKDKDENDPEVLKQRQEMEIIEIGAVKIDKKTYEIIDTFQTFVQPVLNPLLTQYCTNLTSIKSSDVNNADLFKEAYPKFIQWANNPSHFIGWGQYDYNQIKQDCERWSLHPFSPGKYLNGKILYKKYTGHKGRGLRKAVRKFNLQFEGTPHRAISDATMTAKVLKCAKEECYKKK